MESKHITNFVGADYNLSFFAQVTMNALLLMSFCLGNILGPLTFTAQSSPQYIPAKVTIIVVCAVSCIFIGVLQTYYVFENRRRDKLEADGGMVYESDVEFKDKTDRENMGFRYRL